MKGIALINRKMCAQKEIESCIAVSDWEVKAWVIKNAGGECICIDAFIAWKGKI